MMRSTIRTIKRGILLLSGLLGSALALQANAASISYYMDQSNVDAVLPDGTNYLQVTISDGVNGAIDFRVDILQPLLSIAGSGFGLDSFGFNTSGAANTVTAGNITGLPTNWSVVTNTNQDGFARFELVPQTNGAGNRISPTLMFSVANIAGDTVYDYAVLSTGNAGQGNQFFAAHVAGFNANGTASGFFGGSTVAAVPLPAALWLFASAIGGLGFFRRRSK